jgi:hypothetical protein
VTFSPLGCSLCKENPIGTTSAGKFHRPDIISGHYLGHTQAKEGASPAGKTIASFENNGSVILGLHFIEHCTITLGVVVRISKLEPKWRSS